MMMRRLLLKMMMMRSQKDHVSSVYMKRVGSTVQLAAVVV